MKSQIKYFLFLCALCVSVAIIGCGTREVASNEQPVARKNQTPSLLTTQYSLLIQQLGSDDWETRESAQKQLENWPVNELETLESYLKQAIKSPDPEISFRVKYILNKIAPVLEIRKRVKFSDGFLREFPNIYNDSTKMDIQGKFDFLMQVTARDDDGYAEINYKYHDKVTNKDIAGLIGEIFAGNYTELSWHKIVVIISISEGSHISGSYSGGWYKPIPETAPYITRLLKESKGLDDVFITDIIDALDRIDAKESIPEVRKFLYHKSREVKRSSLQALGKLGAKELISEIIPLLKDEYYRVRGWAGVALIELGAKDKVPKEIIKDIKDLNEWIDDNIMRVQAALKELGIKIEEEKKE